ncbi:acetylglutamate kinase [Candidatus Sumerlaeota bacterium]|nr:acetylglutamate kinase [Candidatus Sumerlaeota bacterium]
MNDIAILKEALPYLRKFKGSLFVIKFGGEAMRTREALELLAEDIAFIHGVGISVVLVHGGGVQVTELEKKLGVKSRFVAGRRVTDEGSLGVLKMILGGTLNLELVSVMKQFGAKAVGISGVSGGLLEAVKRPPKKVTGSDEIVDFGHVGDITNVDVTVIHSLLRDGFLPIVSPLAADANGNVLNVNADVAAARIASALKASKLLLMSDTPGVMEDVKDRTTLIGQLNSTQAQAAIKQGIISGGMIPKVEESLGAIKAGVKQVHILSATEPHTLLLEVFTESGCGTMIVE